jgi:hypothetical protein
MRHKLLGLLSVRSARDAIIVLCNAFDLPVLPATQPHVAREAFWLFWRSSSTSFFAWDIVVGSKAAWIPSRDAFRTVGVGAKARAATCLDSKMVLSAVERKRRVKNVMAAVGMKLHIHALTNQWED